MQLTLYGETDGTSTSGNLTLSSEWFESTITEMELDKGQKLVIFLESLSGEGETLIQMEQSVDGGNTWRPEGVALKLASTGHADVGKTKIAEVNARNDETLIRFPWEQPSAVDAYLSLTTELGVT